MTLFEIQEEIAAFIKANWSCTSIREINKDEAPALPYIEAFFKPGLMFNLEIQGVGNRIGVVIINIFTNLGVGVQQGSAYGGELELLFWHKRLEDIVFESDFLPYTQDLGVDAALQAYHHQTTIPFSVITDLS